MTPRTLSPPRPLTPMQLAAWRSFLRAHGAVLRRLDAELTEERGLSLGEYEVLVHLSEAADRRMRMSELAAHALLSRSGLTRLVDRLVSQGLVVRQACPSDARGTFAVLTPAGLARLEEAYPTHLRGVREYVVGALSDDELETLGRLLARVVARAEEG